jgi:hypothetical protein
VLRAQDTDEDEKRMLTQFVSMFRTSFRIAGWDSRRLLSETVLRRCFVHGVPFQWYYHDRFGPRYRYNDTHHLDLRDFLTEYGVAHESMSGLGDVLRVLNVPAPDGLTDTGNVLYSTLMSAAMVCRADRLVGHLEAEAHNIVLQYIVYGVTQPCAAGTHDGFGILNDDDSHHTAYAALASVFGPGSQLWIT